MINVFSPLQSCLFYHFTIIFYYPVVRTHEQNVRRFACGNCRPEQKVGPLDNMRDSCIRSPP